MNHDNIFTNSIGMEFVLIPAGTFRMGSAERDVYALADEKPRHEVTISRPFHLGRFPVTQAQWRAVMGENPSMFKGPDRPVENVSWEDVRAFIAKLNAAEGHERCRLPTEAEWEYAARAGSVTSYCFGDDEGQLGDYAWYGDNSGDETHPVGLKRPNPWGIFDMHGNVFEWTLDWYARKSYQAYRTGAVTDPRGPGAGEARTLRGGCWADDAITCRSAYRSRFAPDGRNGGNGFRLALDTSAVEASCRPDF